MPQNFVADLNLSMMRWEADQERARQNVARLFWSFYHGIEEDGKGTGVWDYFKRSHGGLFVRSDVSDAETWRKMVFRWYPLTAKICKRLSTIYSLPTQREVKGKDGETVEDETKAYSDWADAEMLDVKARDGARLSKLLHASIFKMRWDEVMQRPTIEFVPSHLVHIETSPTSPLTPVAVGFEIDYYGGDYVWQRAMEMWTPETVEVKIQDGTAKDGITMWRTVKSEPNVLGVLPIAVLRDNMYHCFWSPPRTSIVNASNFVNFLLTDLSKHVAYQSFGVGLAVNLKVGSESNTDGRGQSGKMLEMGPDKWLAVEGVREGEVPPSLTFAQPAENMGAMTATADWILKTAGVMEGLGSNVLSSEATEESGRAVLLKNIELHEERVSDRAFGIAFERAVGDLWSLWQIKMNKPGLSEGAYVSVEYDDSHLSPDPAAQWQQEREQIALGLLSKVRWLMRQNPDLDEGAALAELQKIAEQSRFGEGPLSGLANLAEPEPVA